MAVASHLVLLAVWYLFVKFGNVPKFVMPSPVDTAQTLLAGNYNWWGNALVTATEIYGGYLFALIVGEFLGSDKGLGYLMLQVQVTLDTAAMFMAVLLITLIGMVLYGAVLLLERALVVPDARVS